MTTTDAPRSTPPPATEAITEILLPIPVGQLTALAECASRRGTTTAQFIRRVLADFLAADAELAEFDCVRRLIAEAVAPNPPPATQEKPMTIQVNTDNHTDATAELVDEVEATVASALGRFGDRLTRVEAHLSDENSRQKTHGVPMRCRLEARPASRQPVVVTADGATHAQAVAGAVKKLEKLLDSTFGRLDDPRG